MEFAFALPDRADTGGGAGFAYADGMARALRGMGHAAVVHEGEGWSCPASAIPVVDGLLLPALMHDIGRLAAQGGVALIHHVLARAGRDATQRMAVWDAMRAMLPRLRVVATSQPVADRLAADLGITAAVVPPGSDDLPRSPPQDGPCRILSVGVLTPRKGHDLLLRALARLTDVDWSLTIAGAAARDPVHAAHLAALIPELGLSHRVRLLPDPDDASLEPLWRDAQLFALATRWEGYATAVAVALRRGIPVVVTQAQGSGAGAMVPPGAGAVCAFDDGPTLSKCLRRLVF
ncbi:MAG: glycosyltransferase family 4 protein, partial [Gemmatimonadaceae bacterium]|nr:glycosyltransferase family 4 protein [Acetobacteraceae bacterium]